MFVENGQFILWVNSCKSISQMNDKIMSKIKLPSDGGNCVCCWFGLSRFTIGPRCKVKYKIGNKSTNAWVQT